MVNDDDLTIGLVAHHVFCPRRAWLEEHGERTDTAQMATGTVDHAAVDDPSTSRSTRLRAVDVHSPALGLRGRCDSIEIDETDGGVTIVEHKAAPLRRRSEVTEPQAVQLALQARCLRDAGQRVTGASVWFTTTKTRVDVALTDELEDRAVRAVNDTRSVLAQDKPPPPLEDDTRCRSCSHVSVCLPDEHRRRVPARRIAVADPLVACCTSRLRAAGRACDADGSRCRRAMPIRSVSRSGRSPGSLFMATRTCPQRCCGRRWHVAIRSCGARGRGE